MVPVAFLTASFQLTFTTTSAVALKLVTAGVIVVLGARRTQEIVKTGEVLEGWPWISQAVKVVAGSV